MRQAMRWTLFGALSAVASAQTLAPSNSSLGISSGASPIVLALEHDSSMQESATLQPLSDAAVSDLLPPGLNSELFLATPANENAIPSDKISYISCDPAVYPGNINALGVLAAAVTANVTAILLYSTTASYCSLTDYSTSYAFLYTMTSPQQSLTLYNNITASNDILYARIAYKDAISSTNGTPSATGSDSASPSQTGSTTSSGQQNVLGSSPSTAVAMIILYSITGLITALFLVIIVTGAVRAHRHPERYGPRNILGRARQSRAKGLARAMLDTIPIVKFGEREEAKPGDIELGASAHTATQHSEDSVVMEDEKDHMPAARKSTSSARSAIGSAAGVTADPAQAGSSAAPVVQDAPGCSICTDDFEVGQDLRVLPCDHKFHPACIDPWLLNVSGTCPLCRIDLNPDRENEEAQEEGAELPPPLGADAGQRNSFRRSLLYGLMGTTRVQETSAEERMAAIRRLRAEQIARRELADMHERPGSPSDEREHRRRSRFGLFGIRTRRAAEESVREQPEADSSATTESAPAAQGAGSPTTPHTT